MKSLVALTVVIALAMGFAATGATAITQTGTIKGRVVDSLGAPIEGATVTLYDPANEWDHNDVDTIADGTFEFTGQGIGIYKVKFEATDKVDQWYSGKPNFQTAKSVTLSANETLEAIDATLVAGGAIEGTLTPGPGVTNVAAEVRLYDAAGNSQWWGGWSVDVTDADPHFEFTGLAPGTYKVVADPNSSTVLTQWFDGKSTFDSANGIVVVAETTKTASMTLRLGATIKGRVTNGTTGLPAEVKVFNSLNNQVGSTSADGTGDYTITGLAPGDYKVYAEKWEYVGEYYNDKPTFAAAAPVTVDGTQTVTGIDFVLAKGQKVSGKVVDASGKGLPLVDVVIFGKTALGIDFDREDRTASDGKYEFYGMPNGTYKVLFDPDPLNSANTTLAPDTGMVKEYFNDKLSEEAANVVSVDSTAVAGIDATLAAGGAITGVVTDASGAAAGGVGVGLLIKSGDDAWWVADATTNPDGSYEFKGVAPGTNYIVQFGNFSWYDGGTARDFAKTVTVVAGQVTSGINGKYSTSFGVVEGFAYGSDGVPAAGVKVIVAREGAAGVYTEIPHDYTTTRQDGSFEVYGLGKVKLRFTDAQGRFADAFYGGTTAADSKSIVLEAGKTIGLTQTLAFKQTDSAEGSDRFGTSVAVSKRAFPRGCDTLVIATGRNWPDALGGAGLAGYSYGPILLVEKDVIPSVVMDEITRLAAESEGFWKVYILGSDSVISTKVENQLRGMFDVANREKTVVRLAGATRYETAGKIADELIKISGPDFSGTALVSTGLNYPDALAASPLAAAKGLPLFLVDANGVTDAVAASMQAKGIKSAIILGSDKVVSKASADKLVAKFGAGNVTRLAGLSRYTTAIEIAKYGVSQGMSWKSVGFATGTNFPDALSGGVLQGNDNSVMLLTPGTSLDPAVETLIKEKKAGIFEVRFFGSTAAISKTVRDKIAAARK